MSDSDSSSIELFKKDVGRYPTIQYVFLKNMGRSAPPQWTSFDENETIKSLIKQKRISVHELPGIPSAILDQLRVSNAKLVDVLNDKTYKTFGLSKGMRIRGWLTNTRHVVDAAMPMKQKRIRKQAVEQSEVSTIEQTEVTEALLPKQLVAPATRQKQVSTKRTKSSTATKAQIATKEKKASATA